MIKRILYILTFIGSLLYSQEYCAGEQISSTHQNQIFNVCYGECDCEGWSLSDYAGDIIFLDLSASWCAPCFSSIDIIDDLEEYWSDENANVRFVTALSDIGEPYSCNQWGNEGVLGSPLIVEDDGSLFDWFKDSNGQYPSYVLIDHTMTVRAKPSNMFSNSNDNSCDGENLEGECLNSLITDLLDECGNGCSSGSGCSDESACNNGDNADCIYPANNYNCCGECIADIDCLGVCGGDATEEECGSTTFECNLPTCHLVSSDSEIYSTIQAGIDAAVDGDTVLVEQGIYYENLVLQKSITLTSRALFDDLDGWVGYEDEYVILNDNITGTIIDGSMDINGEGFESTILITSPDDECISPLIFGFTIQGGSGTVVLVEEDSRDGEREIVEMNLGGGFLALGALPSFNYNQIINNKKDEGDIEPPIEAGGGGDIGNGDQFELRSFPNPDYDFSSTRSDCNGDIDLSYNLWSDNDASYGNTLSTNDFAGSLDMSSSIYDIYNCPEEEVSPVWVDVDEAVDVDFNNGVGDLCSITDDVYVSPDGNDNNIGTSEAEAFLTIQRALEMIAPEDDDPVTIFLTEGTFSPSTIGETFSILMISNVNLIGQGEEVTILDAEQSGRVITMENCDNNTISDLTITGGNATDGGGMYLTNSDPTLNNVTISNNTADWEGGGMYLEFSNPTLNNVTISNNMGYTEYCYGGGMWLYYSDPILTHVTISNNAAEDGGGMWLYSSNPTLTHVTISNNWAYYGGGISLQSSNPILTHVTISNNMANEGGGMSLYNNSNPTLTHVTIISNTADWGGGGMRLSYSNPILTHVTITNNAAEDGGGMRLSSSYPTLNHVTISNNTADIGSGMWLDYSDPILTHVTISNNAAVYGGGMYLYYSDPILTNSIIWDNSPESIYISSGTPLITYSDIEGGFEGEGNIDDDPLFNEDYTLQASSPCIDAGIIIEDMEYCGDAPDMGAYEYIAEDCMEQEIIAGDINFDGVLDILDIVTIINYILPGDDWNNGNPPSEEQTAAADVNEDGFVNILDIVTLMQIILP